MSGNNTCSAIIPPAIGFQELLIRVADDVRDRSYLDGAGTRAGLTVDVSTRILMVIARHSMVRYRAIRGDGISLRAHCRGIS